MEARPKSNLDVSKDELLEGISVVVPVYNSERTLPELIAELGQSLPAIGERFEVLLVNDGSRDRSWEIIRSLSAQNSWVRGISMARNFGQHNALLCGIRGARYSFIVTLDDDLQHPPSEIRYLLEKLREGYDVVYGVPKAQRHSWWRNLLSVLVKELYARVTGVPAIRDISAFRALRTRLRRAFDQFTGPNLLLDVLLSWSSARFASVQVERQARKVGRSGYTLSRLFNQAMLLLTGFSTGPLRLGIFMGFIFTLFGSLILCWVVVGYFLRGSLPGFTFLASIISIFGGVQLFTLGIFGEYLARIFNRSLERPTYVVSEVTEPPSCNGMIDVKAKESCSIAHDANSADIPISQ